ncbi:M20/M25/M40 family metallo-hydrolase [Candidatus Aerophobetes bacterium]|nr:M20/M25/M40 family metallo-hydrolase [Candidatus Aerophobetes bacterium]
MIKKDFIERVLEVLKILVETPTPTGEEERLHGFLSSFLEKAGFKVHIQKVPGSFSNLIAKRGKSSFLVCTHLDTYPPFDHPQPYRMRRCGEVVVGRGVVDPKGQIACLLVAIEMSDAPCQVAFTSGEEEEALGSRFLEVEAEEAVVLEPTDLVVCLSQAGAIEIEVEVEGKAVHGSCPWEGENAVLKAFEIYRRLEELSFLKKVHPHFPRGGWINLGKIEGGKDVMVVPYRCSFQADIGVVPGTDVEQALIEIKKVVEEEGGNLKLKDISSPFEIKPHLRSLELLESCFKKVAGKTFSIGGMPSWTDAENFWKKKIPCLIFGAGKLSSAHSNFESISLKELETFTLLLTCFLNRLDF